jgi:cytochrome c biogenesis protein CcmG, thiol:disulfide interchange protein DsbE
MRRQLVVLVAVVAMIAACGGTDAARPGDRVMLEPTGDLLTTELPTFQEGERFRLADVVGGPVVVNFFSSWCAPCVREMPAIEAVKQALDGEVTFVGVDVQDTIDDGLALIEETGITWETARDPDGVLTLAAQVQGMPTTLLLDDGGQVLERHTGALTQDDLATLFFEHFGIEVPLP